MEYFYLDIGPMVRRLRQNPTEFELRDKSICHRPSSIRFTLTGNGNDRIIARCNGIEFPISREQGAVLRTALATWTETYCRPSMDHGGSRRVIQGGRKLARQSVAKAQWRRLIGAMLALFDISARRRRKRGSRPNLCLISSLSEDTKLSAGAAACTKIEPGKPALSLLVSLAGDDVPSAGFPLRPNPSSTAAKTRNK